MRTRSHRPAPRVIERYLRFSARVLHNAAVLKFLRVMMPTATLIKILHHYAPPLRRSQRATRRDAPGRPGSDRVVDWAIARLTWLWTGLDEAKCLKTQGPESVDDAQYHVECKGVLAGAAESAEHRERGLDKSICAISRVEEAILDKWSQLISAAA
jgi:hypothetical protein